MLWLWSIHGSIDVLESDQPFSCVLRYCQINGVWHYQINYRNTPYNRKEGVGNHDDEDWYLGCVLVWLVFVQWNVLEPGLHILSEHCLRSTGYKDTTVFLLRHSQLIETGGSIMTKLTSNRMPCFDCDWSMLWIFWNPVNHFCVCYCPINGVQHGHINRNITPSAPGWKKGRQPWRGGLVFGLTVVVSDCSIHSCFHPNLSSEPTRQPFSERSSFAINRIQYPHDLFDHGSCQLFEIGSTMTRLTSKSRQRSESLCSRAWGLLWSPSNKSCVTFERSSRVQHDRFDPNTVK